MAKSRRLRSTKRRSRKAEPCPHAPRKPGRPSSALPSIHKLQRGTNQPTFGEESSGLGLYITRKLAESMNGEVGFEPKPKQGSIFRVSLLATT